MLFFFKKKKKKMGLTVLGFCGLALELLCEEVACIKQLIHISKA